MTGGASGGRGCAIRRLGRGFRFGGLRWMFLGYGGVGGGGVVVLAALIAAAAAAAGLVSHLAGSETVIYGFEYKKVFSPNLRSREITSSLVYK